MENDSGRVANHGGLGAGAGDGGLELDAWISGWPLLTLALNKLTAVGFEPTSAKLPPPGIEPGSSA